MLEDRLHHPLLHDTARMWTMDVPIVVVYFMIKIPVLVLITKSLKQVFLDKKTVITITVYFSRHIFFLLIMPKKKIILKKTAKVA